MTNARKTTVLSVIAATLIAALPMTASADSFVDGATFELSQTHGMDRRDGRQDCRSAEGAVVADKRNCKQDNRQSNHINAPLAAYDIADTRGMDNRGDRQDSRQG